MVYAHSANDAGQMHPLTDHLRETARRARELAAKFGGGDLAYDAGLWHDLGKFSSAFQEYIRAPERRHGPDHSSAGAILAADTGGLLGQRWCGLLTYLVAGHHAGLPDDSSLRNRIGQPEKRAEVQEALRRAREAMPDLQPSQPPSVLADFERLWSARELFLRMIFSALVDSDFLDTERHFHPEEAARRAPAVTVENLWAAFQAYQARRMGLPGDLNRLRDQLYRECMQKAEDPQGLYLLSAPTGIGKTRSALGFALKHAKAHSLDRVIVALPYLSIIDQTADVYGEIFGDLGEDAFLEHHSAVDWHDDAGQDAQKTWARLAAENWDAPLVLTTTVQLFESLLANRSSRTRKLHNIARSVLVLDEVQALPLDLLEPVMSVLGDLVARFGVTVVCSTATQFPLHDDPLGRFFRGTRDIVPDPQRYFAALRRVRYEVPKGTVTWERVAEKMRHAPQSMAVVNTKRDALALLEALKDQAGEEGPDTFHLSTFLCGAHRRAVLAEVRERLKDGRSCRLVATQVVEAGVDISFPIVLRALGPLDRIVQAAGRCNRHGELPELGRVVIFEPDSNHTPPGYYRTATDETRSFLKTAPDLHDPGTYEEYFRRLFTKTKLDGKKVQDLRKGLNFETVAKTFRLTDDDTIPVAVSKYRPEEVLPLLACIRNGQGSPRKLFGKLQPYVVNVYRGQTSRMVQQGLMAEVVPGLYEWRGDYDRVRGIGGASLPDPESLIF